MEDVERELALHVHELTRTTAEQQTERAHLEQLEEVRDSRQEALDRRESNFHAEADACLVKKQDDMEEELAQKAKDIHAQAPIIRRSGRRRRAMRTRSAG